MLSKALKPKHYYFFAFAILAVFHTILLLKWDTGQRTISFVGTTNGLSRALFSAGTLIAATLNYLFLKDYFLEKVRAKSALKTSLYAGSCAMFGVGIFPASAGLPLKLHAIFATILGLSLVLSALLLARQKVIKTVMKFHAVLVAALIIFSVVVIEGIAGQVSAILLFNILILEITYAS